MRISLLYLETVLGISLVILAMDLPQSPPSSLTISKKCWVSSSFISLLVSTQLPSALLIFWIHELFLFWRTELWKNLVFLSPSYSHFILDFCFQKIPSHLSLASRWNKMYFSFTFMSLSHPSSIPFLLISSISLFCPKKYSQTPPCCTCGFWP